MVAFLAALSTAGGQGDCAQRLKDAAQASSVLCAARTLCSIAKRKTATSKRCASSFSRMEPFNTINAPRNEHMLLVIPRLTCVNTQLIPQCSYSTARGAGRAPPTNPLKPQAAVTGAFDPGDSTASHHQGTTVSGGREASRSRDALKPDRSSV